MENLTQGALERNELKVTVLRQFESSPLTSHEMRELLAQKGITLTHRALEMALLRYWRQGLLLRARKGRRFNYSLTPRGRARLDWLIKNSHKILPR